MKISIEVSMYPLDINYIPQVQNFIDRMNEHHNIVVNTNTMSTQIFGELDVVMDAIKNEISLSFLKDNKSVFVMKIINSNLNFDL